MKKLYIIGARGFGREVYNLATKVLGYNREFEIVGFLDDKKNALDGFNGYPPIVSNVEDFVPSSDDIFICALGNPFWKRHYAEIIEKKGGNFITLIHPNAKIGLNTRIGVGCIITGPVDISCDVKIGNHSTVWTYCVIGHDACIHSFCHIGAFGFMGGGAILEEEVEMHPRVNILPHIKIGKNAILGAGAVVLHNIKENSTAVGVPARELN